MINIVPRRHNLTIHTVLQNCFPRISKTTLMPVPSMPFQPETAEEWYEFIHSFKFIPHILHYRYLLIGILLGMEISIIHFGLQVF